MCRERRCADLTIFHFGNVQLWREEEDASGANNNFLCVSVSGAPTTEANYEAERTKKRMKGANWVQ